MLRMFARLIWPTLLCMSAETAALEDGLINALQHAPQHQFHSLASLMITRHSPLAIQHSPLATAM
jgi:hypothetical protein